MSTSDVVNLDDYRAYRDGRLRLLLALYQPDVRRRLLALRVWEALELIGGDRGAVVWIDEYGPGVVHTHCILDLASERPRRSFAIEPLRQAWESGIPGVLDEPDLIRSGDRILPEAPRSICAVALGSDGTRAWFLVVDSRSARTDLEGASLDSLLFLAGECASLVIPPLEDSEPALAHRGEPEESVAVEASGSRFAGWSVLRDREEDGGRGLQEDEVTLRFLVARVVRGWAEDDFCAESEGLAYQTDAVRDELAARELPEAARESVAAILRSIDEGDLPELAGALVRAAVDAEREGHFHGARELDHLAYDAAVAACHPRVAVRAARRAGRVARRMGRWDESQVWYEAGGAIARAAGLKRGEALALDGLGNTYRDRGSLPDARRSYLAALDLGTELDDSEVRARSHQNLAVLEKHAGRTDEALEHGWSAVESCTTADSFYRALADLGDLFLRCGELESAAQALEVITGAPCDREIRVPALELRGHVAALRGDRAGFREWSGKVESEGINVAVRAEMMLCRGMSHLALGERDEAREWTRRSLEFAEEHRVSRLIIEAGETLDRLDRQGGDELLARELPEPRESTMSGLREPLAALGEPAGLPA